LDHRLDAALHQSVNYFIIVLFSNDACWGGEKHSTFLLGMLPQSEQANYPPVHLRSSWGVSHNLYHPFPISEGDGE
jgi:hypothetical protein